MNDGQSENVRAVPIGEMLISHTPGDVLVAYGLGSCVAVCLYDPITHVGGMLHALLPEPATESRGDGQPAKFVDRGISLLLQEMLKLGARRARMQVYLCGGAKMVPNPEFKDLLNIGERNVQSARSILKAMHLHIRAESTGGMIGRTVKLYVNTGKVTVRTIKDGEWLLSEKK